MSLPPVPLHQLKSSFSELVELSNTGTYEDLLISLNNLKKIFDLYSLDGHENAILIGLHRLLIRLSSNYRGRKPNAKFKSIEPKLKCITEGILECTLALKERGFAGDYYFTAIRYHIYFVEQRFPELLEVLNENDSLMENQYFLWLKIVSLQQLDRSFESRDLIPIAQKISSPHHYMSYDWISLENAARVSYINKWPGSVDNFESVEGLLTNHLKYWNGAPKNIIQKNEAIMTIGSCFATNIASELQDNGFSVTSFAIGEQLNSTTANLQLFESIAKFSETGEDFPIFDNINIGDLGGVLKRVSTIIYTCGTSIALEDRTDSRSMHADAKFLATYFSRAKGQKATFRKIGALENYQNLMRIIEICKIYNPKMKIVLTVSPVPLTRSFVESSGIIGDCISKSCLRTAVDMVIDEKMENVFYWPSFEISKWIVPHLKAPVSPDLFFGYDDGISRHVSKTMVKNIVGKFLSYAVRE
jgi:hypothetical protein